MKTTKAERDRWREEIKSVQHLHLARVDLFPESFLALLDDADRVEELEGLGNRLRNWLRTEHRSHGLECFCDDCKAYELSHNRIPLYNADGDPYDYGLITRDDD